MLGELGVYLSDLDFEPEQLKELGSSGIKSDGSGGQLLSDAISFLVELTAQEDNPEAIYYKEVRSYNLLSRDQEAILGRRIEEATASTMEAIANCPPAISRILEFAQRVAAEEMRMESFVQSIADSKDDVGLGGPKTTRQSTNRRSRTPKCYRGLTPSGGRFLIQLGVISGAMLDHEAIQAILCRVDHQEI